MSKVSVTGARRSGHRRARAVVVHPDRRRWRVDGEQSQAPRTHAVGDRRPLGPGPRRLADGEQGQDTAGGERLGRRLGDVLDAPGVQAGHAGQLSERQGRLREHAVNPGRSVLVGGDVGDDEHGRRHRRAS